MVIGQGDVAGVPIAVIIMLLVVLLFWVVSEHTQFGRTLCAIGSNAEASRLAASQPSDIPRALSICAVCSALGGVIVSSTLGAAGQRISAIPISSMPSLPFSSARQR